MILAEITDFDGILQATIESDDEGTRFLASKGCYHSIHTQELILDDWARQWLDDLAILNEWIINWEPI